MRDSLTKLSSRQDLYEQLCTLLAQRRATQQRFAVLLVDIDRFADLNNAAGCSTGDRLLVEIANRIQDAIRPCDIVGRFGDDEFAVILPAIHNAGQAILAATKIGEVVQTCVNLSGKSVRLTASTGIAIFPEHGDDSDTLLRRANLALAEAKRPDTTFHVFEEAQEQGNDSNLQLEQNLRNAIERSELSAYYQPKVDCKTGVILGVEALTRWINPKHEAISPDKFIPLAEQTGLIRPLTYWALKTAIGQAAKWQTQGYKLSVAVNVSPCTLEGTELPALTKQVLQLWNLDPKRLVLEITEGALMNDPERSLGLLRQLNELGVSLSIDDFGTGYSSLAYLKQLPVRELKIDKAFVLNMAHDKDDEAIVRSVIAMAKNFNLRVVAEGVEDQHTWDLLTQLGCDVIQGYFISAPKPPEAITQLLADRT